MKLPHLLEFISFLVMGNVSRAGIDPSGRNSTETVPNLDIDAVNGHISILDNSTSMLDNSSHTFSHMDNGTLDEDNIDVKLEESGCNDYAHGSECCEKIGEIPLVKKNDDYVCLNMTYQENGTVIRFHLTWNGDEKMSGELLDFKEDICASIPIPKIGPLIGICLNFTKYSRVNETLRGCVNLKLKIITLSFDVCLGCFGDAGHTCSAAGPEHSYSFLLFTMVLIRLFH